MATAPALPAPFFSEYSLAQGYDEMFTPEMTPRPAYELLLQRLQELSPEELAHRQLAADQTFLDRGITFTVYGHGDATEKIFPYDVLPRIVSAPEWDRVERGLVQRITALNLFLKDVYGEGKILADGVVPRRLVVSCKHY